MARKTCPDPDCKQPVKTRHGKLAPHPKPALAGEGVTLCRMSNRPVPPPGTVLHSTRRKADKPRGGRRSRKVPA